MAAQLAANLDDCWAASKAVHLVEMTAAQRAYESAARKADLWAAPLEVMSVARMAARTADHLVALSVGSRVAPSVATMAAQRAGL